MTVCSVSVCVWGWKGLSVKKSTDTQKSPPGPNQDTEGDASVTETGTDCCASVHYVSEDVVFAVINSLAKTVEVDQLPFLSDN